MEQPEKLNLTSLDIKQQQLEKLKELFPEVFTEGNKVDWDKLRLTLGEQIDVGKERFGMNWPGKADCFKTIQQPSIATLVPARDESVDFDDSQNIFIEGDNLEVLKLLQKSYLGKIKMIYIDPPYNTGKDFIYPDNYSENLQTYLEYTEQADSEGKKFSTNTETDGRFHSKWMNMMYTRLFLSKNLLKEDGAIFISIDDNEVDNLKKICNEIFGDENFRNTIVLRRGVKNVQSQFETLANLSNGHEYILFYSKRSDFRLPKLSHDLENIEAGKWDTFWRGTDRPTMRYELFGKKPDKGQWRWEKDRALQADQNYKEYVKEYSNVAMDDYFWDHYRATNEKLDFVRLNDEGVVQYYVPPRDYKLISDNWMDISIKGNVIGFDTEKHVDLMKRLIKWMLGDGEIILDFFAGSCSTAHATLELNMEDSVKRKFICVQLPEVIDENSEAHKSGFRKISDLSKERIRRAIETIKTERQQILEKEKSTLFGEQQRSQLDLGLKVFKLQSSNFSLWQTDVAKSTEAIARQLELNIHHISQDAGQEAILFELLLKSGFELATRVNKDAIAGKTVFSVAEGELLICLEKDLSLEVIKGIAEKRPSRVICLDEGFQNNDQLKTNAVQIMKSKGVVKFQTV